MGALCLVAAGLFALAMSSEFRFARLEGASPPSLVAELPGMLPLAPSERSRTIVLRRCQALLGSFYLRALPTPTRLASLSGCAGIAEAIVRQTPAHGYAWLVLGLARGQLGDAAGFDAAMVESQAAAPNVGWLVQARALALEGRADSLGAAAQQALAADFSSMLRGRSGTCTLARLYRNEAGARDRINVAVTAAAPAEAEAFLRAARGEDAGRCPVDGA